MVAKKCYVTLISQHGKGGKNKNNIKSLLKFNHVKIIVDKNIINLIRFMKYMK